MDKKELRCIRIFWINLFIVLFFMGSLLITIQPLIFIIIGYFVLIMGWYYESSLSKFKYTFILLAVIINFVGMMISIPFEKMFM